MRIRNQIGIRQSQGGFATLIILTCIIIMVAILSRNASTITILKKTQTLQSRTGQPDWSPASIPGNNQYNDTNVTPQSLPDRDLSNMNAENDSEKFTDTELESDAGFKEEQGESEDTTTNDPEVFE